MDIKWSIASRALEVGIVAFFLFGSTLSLAADSSIPAVPQHFSFVAKTDSNDCAYFENLMLNGSISLRIQEMDSADLKLFKLFIDDQRLDTGPQRLPGNILKFSLERSADEANRKAWKGLLGRPFTQATEPGGLRNVKVVLLYNDKPVHFTCTIASEGSPQEPKTDDSKKTPEQLAKENEARKDAKNAAMQDAQAVSFRIFSWPCMILALGGSLLVLVLTALAGSQTGMLRDVIHGDMPPQIRVNDRPLSLGRLQMALWLCVVLASFVFILTVTGDFNSINSETFMLIGISGATALGSIAVDQTKDSGASAANTSLSSIGLVTVEQSERLYRLVEKENQGSKRAKDVFPGATASANSQANPSTVNLDPTLLQLWTEYQKRIAPYKSAGFFTDLVTDKNGPTLHRWQALIWTLLLAGIYLGRVYANLETPTFGTNLLALMGISSGVYVGFKIAEK